MLPSISMIMYSRSGVHQDEVGWSQLSASLVFGYWHGQEKTCRHPTDFCCQFHRQRTVDVVSGLDHVEMRLKPGCREVLLCSSFSDTRVAGDKPVHHDGKSFVSWALYIFHRLLREVLCDRIAP